MKPSAVLLAIVASAAVFASAAPASAQTVAVGARVPFEFKLGETPLPRGTYQVSRVNGRSDVLFVRGLRGSSFVLGQNAEREDGSLMPALVFHRYGDTYFLREIRTADSRVIDLPATADEQEVAGRLAQRSEPRIVVIAALP